MDPLGPPDTHFLSSAIGWMELGNAGEARVELAQLSAAARAHPDALEVLWMVHAQEADWTSALVVAAALVDVAPDRASGWLHRAYALRRVANGGLPAALEALAPAAGRFPTEPVIPYNLACYCCQLGQLDEARQWLDRAATAGDRTVIRKMALADADLEPLWDEIRAWANERGGP